MRLAVLSTNKQNPSSVGNDWGGEHGDSFKLPFKFSFKFLISVE